jgi:pimeloyl-ACP methyl ester carboxylesterase
MSASISSITVDPFTVPYSTLGEGFPVFCCELPLNSFARFAPLQQTLSKSFQTFVIDLRPVVGASAQRPPAEDLLEFLSGYFIRMLDAFGIQECHLIGSFMFGAISMNIARLAAARIRSLVLLGSLGIAGLPATPLMRFITGFYRMPGIPPAMRVPPLRAMVEFTDHYFLGPLRMREMFQDPSRVSATLEELYEHYRKPRNDFAGTALMWAIRNMSYRSLIPRLSEVIVPALIIHGEQDRWISKDSAEELQRRLPVADLVVIPETRHAPEMEDVEKTAAAIMTFFQQHSGKREFNRRIEA